MNNKNILTVIKVEGSTLSTRLNDKTMSSKKDRGSGFKGVLDTELKKYKK